FDLMFDAVFNHMSAQGDWFQRFLRDEPEFRDFFVTVKGNPDLSHVVRPRALPLWTEFPTARGPERVWTTFSADQVDVNVKNPRVLLALVDALLFYVADGGRFFRLDAIAYLWKEIGTSCIHLPQTHAVIQLMRAVLDEVAPHVQLITETNVPHADNIAYFGDGTNEAQLVYNFALPPLVLHALLRGDAAHLTRWAITLSLAGVPGIYFHSLFGSRNDREAALESGINRRINRQKLTLAELEADLGIKRSLRTCVFGRYRVLLKARRSHGAFNPHAEQRVFEEDRRVFAVLRTAVTSPDWVLCLHNVTNERVTLKLATANVASAEIWTEMLYQRPYPVSANGTISVTLGPYEVNWMAARGPRP